MSHKVMDKIVPTFLHTITSVDIAGKERSISIMGLKDTKVGMDLHWSRQVTLHRICEVHMN